MENNVYGRNEHGEETVHTNMLDLIIDKCNKHKKFFILGEGIDNKYTIEYKGKIFDIEGENTSQFIISDKLLNGITLSIIDYLVRRKKNKEYDIILSRVKRIIDTQGTKEYVKIGTLFFDILTEFSKSNPNREKIYDYYLKLVKDTSLEYFNWCDQSLREIMKSDPSKISNIGDIVRYAYEKTLAIRDKSIANYMKKIFRNGNGYCYCIIIGKNHERNIQSLLTVYHTETIGKEELVRSHAGGYYDKYIKYEQKTNNILKLLCDEVGKFT
jgi:hypothetical protein